MTTNARAPLQSFVALALASGLAASGCGARTGLPVPPDETAEAAGATGQGGAAGQAPLPCTPGVFTSARANPTVLLLLDRSQSMNQSFQAGQTRWEALTEALTSSLPAADTEVALGALLFPSKSSGGSSGGQASCQVSTGVDLAPALGNVGALLSLLGATSPGGATPTADALSVGASALLNTHAATGARALVLATDGGPDCNAALDPATCTCVSQNSGCQSALRCLDSERTVARIAGYLDLGLPTYVIGIQQETGASSEVLDAMAKAGGRALVGAQHSYYAAGTQGELADALVAIRDQISCTYLTTSVPDDQGSIEVMVGDTEVPYDAGGKTGWRWASKANGELVLPAQLCGQLAADQTPVVRVGCGEQAP